MTLTRVATMAFLALHWGCNDNSSTGGTPDQSVIAAPDQSVPADLAIAPDQSTLADMTAPDDLSLLTCAGIFRCIVACPPANLNTCVPDCINRGSPDAQSHFTPLEQCSAPACYAPLADGGAPPCSQPATVACATCVMNNCGAQLADCQAH